MSHIRDYIKNVASSEIYATWPRSTIVANVLAIMSFTLNRGLYWNGIAIRDMDFTITSSTAYDHKMDLWAEYFESISVVVDDIFDNYLSRAGSETADPDTIPRRAEGSVSGVDDAMGQL